MKSVGVVLSVVALSLVTASSSVADYRWNTVGGVWSDKSNWTPAIVPGPGNTAHIGLSKFTAGEVISLDGKVTIEELKVEGGAIVDNTNRSLRVDDVTRLMGGAEQTTRLRVHPAIGFGGDFTTYEMHIENGAGLEIYDNATARIENLLTVAPDGMISGQGKLRMLTPQEPIQGFSNDGTVWATGPLTIRADGHERVLLDGASETGRIVVEAPNAMFTIDGGHHFGAFGGQMRVAGGNEIRLNFDSPWELASSGEVRFTKSPHNTAHAFLGGQSTTIHGTIAVEDSAHGVMRAATFEDNAQVVVGSDGQLDLYGPVQINGGQFTSQAVDGSNIRLLGATTWAGLVSNQGRVFQNGAATVAQSTIINGGILDMDGQANSTRWNIDHSLVLNVDSLDDEMMKPNRFNGRMTVGTEFGFGLAKIEVNLPNDASWSMAGDMTLKGNHLFPQVRVAGNTMNLLGSLEVDSRVVASAPLNFAANSTTTLEDVGDQLRLDNDATVFADATFVGNGSLKNHANLVLRNGSSLGEVEIHNASVFFIQDDGIGIAGARSFSNAAEATLSMEVATSNGQMESDQLVLGDTADIAGMLSLSVIDGVEMYETVPLITTVGGVAGQFSRIRWPAEQDFGLAVTYDATSVKLTAAVPGDADLNGTVEFGDFLRLSANFGVAGTWAAGDFDGDGEVLFSDFLQLADNFGTSYKNGAAVAVPEPAAGAFLGGLICLVTRRRRRPTS